MEVNEDNLEWYGHIHEIEHETSVMLSQIEVLKETLARELAQEFNHRQQASSLRKRGRDEFVFDMADWYNRLDQGVAALHNQYEMIQELEQTVENMVPNWSLHENATYSLAPRKLKFMKKTIKKAIRGLYDLRLRAMVGGKNRRKTYRRKPTRKTRKNTR